MTVTTEIMTSIAGTGTSSYSGDGGQATAAALQPQGIAVDSSGILVFLFSSISFTNIFSLGNVYIADTRNYRVRKITVSTGIITTIAGTGTYGFTGDNGAASSATLWPAAVAVDTSGKLVYI